MEPIDFEPRYSTSEVSGQCIKCLTEHEINSCYRELLRMETNGKEARQKYRLLVDFLKSEESRRLRDESERCLADGKKVILRLSFTAGKPRYELKTSEQKENG